MTNWSKNWDLQIKAGVSRVLRKLPRADAERVSLVIRLLPVGPYFGDIQKMKGESDVWRRRVGNYRLFYCIKSAEMVILVFHLERRTSSTY